MAPRDSISKNGKIVEPSNIPYEGEEQENKTSMIEDDEDEIDVDLEMGRRQQQQGEHQKVLVCCPLTKQPFREPVVHPRGVSYEKDAVKEQFVGLVDSCYPNRALKDYLDPTTDPRVELQASNPDKKNVFFCPLTIDLLRDPVIDPEGNTYERHAILESIKEHGISPLSRNPLQMEQLYDNTTLLTVLIQEVQQCDESLNPEEIKDWKREVSRIARADRPLSARELDQALRPPPVPNPPLSAIRAALAEEEEEDPPLASLQEALRTRPPQVDTSPPPPPPAPVPLLLQELEQVQEDEEFERRLNEEADRYLDILCKRHGGRFCLVVVLLLLLAVGLFWMLTFVMDVTTMVSFGVTAAVLLCCCLALGQPWISG